MIGKTISHYKILEKLGGGGMGVVYRAEDTKLKRLVAIKFLPRQIAAGDEERERFKIEAQAAAALNHPNIATIHAIEEVDGEMFIVMEYIEGKELRKIVTSEQLSVNSVIDIATQIAEGLKAAHAKGITHRDIKSSNIMVTTSGQVKIMDLLVDLHRLHRSSSGQDAQIIAATEKITHKRAQKRPLQFLLVPGLIAGLAAVVIGAYFIFSAKPDSSSSLPPMRTVRLTSFQGEEYNPALSPDGKSIAFSWNGLNRNNFDIYVQLVDAGSPLRLTTDPAGDYRPAWSHDGRYISFVRPGLTRSGIYIVPALGGAERKVAETTPLLESSMCWALDGQSLFTADKDSAGAPFSIFAIDIATSEKQEVTTPPPQDVGDHTPRLSPDGKSLAFIRTRETGIDDVYLFSLNGKKTQRLTFDNLWIYGLAWTADGREIIFPSNRGGGYKFWRILKSGGTPEPIALAGDMVTDPTISWQQNRLAYNQSIYNVNIGQVELTNPANPAPLIVSTQVSVYPHVSPDGEKIAFISNRSGSLEVWTCDRDGMNPLQLTRFSGPVLSMPRWAPDGQQIAFDARGEGRASIYLMRPDGSRQQQLTPGEYEEIFPSWSRDGKWIYFSSNRTGLYQVWKILAKGGEAVQVTRNGGLVANESPDGKFVYYTRSFPDARIWRMPVNAGDEELVFDQIAPDYVAAWALAEKGIFFVNPEARPRAAIEFFDFATRQTTHIAHIVKEPHAWGLTLSPDEKSILYVQLDQTETDIVLVENFR